MSFAPLTALLQRWKAAFESADVEALVSLYSVECFLFGGKPFLSSGQQGIRQYFSALSAIPLRVEFEDQSFHRIAHNVISSAGFVAFRRADGPATRYRLTLTFLLSGDRWQIVSHHASPVPI